MPMPMPMRFTLRLVRLNTGGYEYGRVGRYFGIGAPLYRYTSDDGDIVGYVRAHYRAYARAVVIGQNPGATCRR